MERITLLLWFAVNIITIATLWYVMEYPQPSKVALNRNSLEEELERYKSQLAALAETCSSAREEDKKLTALNGQKLLFQPYHVVRENEKLLISVNNRGQIIMRNSNITASIHIRYKITGSLTDCKAGQSPSLDRKWNNQVSSYKIPVTVCN